MPRAGSILAIAIFHHSEKSSRPGARGLEPTALPRLPVNQLTIIQSRIAWNRESIESTNRMDERAYRGSS